MMQNSDKDGRESDNKMLTYSYYFLERNICITCLYNPPSPQAFSFFLFLCRYILYNLHIELMKIPMTHFAQTFNIPFVKCFRLATGTLCWIKEQLSSHTISIANFARHLIA